MSTTSTGFYLRTEDDVCVVRRLAEMAVVSAADEMVRGDGTTTYALDLSEVRLDVMEDLHAVLCAVSALDLPSDDGAEAHWQPLDGRMVAALRDRGASLIRIYGDVPNAPWDRERVDIARRAMAALDAAEARA